MPLSPSLDPIFQAAGQQYNVDPELLKAVALTESSGNTAHSVVSNKGAEGLMQFMPATAKQYGVSDPFDPAQAIPGAAHYISDLLSRAESNGLQGPAAVSRALGGYYGREDPNYVGMVARYYVGLTDGSGGGTGTPAPSWAGDPAPLKGAVMGAGGEPLRFQQAGGGVKLVPVADQAAPAAPAPDIMNDPTIQGLINGTIKVPAPHPLATVGQSPGVISGTPVFDPQLGAAYLRDAFATPGMEGAIGPLVTALGQGLPRAGGFHYVIGPDGTTQLVPMPGYVQGASQVEGAKAGAEANAKVPSETLLKEIQGEIDRRNAAAVPQKVTPGETVFYPPGSPNADMATSTPSQTAAQSSPASSNGMLSAASGPGGGTVVTGMPPNDTTKQYFTELDKLGDQANAARLGLYQSQLLEQQLHAIGTSGPATEYLARLGALAQQFGVPKETVDKYINAASVQNSNKLSQDLLGEVLKATFPQRITNADITAWQNTVPRSTTLLDSNDFLFHKVLNPKFQRDISRYGDAVNADMEHTPLSLHRFLNGWDNDHPYQAFAPPTPAPAQSTNAASPAGASPDRAALEAEMRRRGLLK